MRNEMKSPLNGKASAFGGMREISTSWGLITIFGAAVILFGGALTYYYRMAPTTYDYEVQNTGTAVNTSADATKDWKTYTNSTYGYSGKYPKDWTFNDKTSASNNVATLYSPKVAAQKKEIADKNLAVGGPISEVTIYYYQSVKELDGSSDKKYSVLLDAINDPNFISAAKETTLSGVKAFEGVQTGMYNSYTVLAEKNGHVYQIAFNNIGNKGQLTAILNSILSTFKIIASASTTVSSGATVSSTSAAWKTYANTTYGFGLTFTDAWEGYKLKEVNLEGTVKTFYVNIPTKDPIYASETSTAYAGYAAPFVISVIEKSKWQDDEIFARDFGSKVGEKGNYIFTSSQWQACPTDLCSGEISSSLKTVMDSFKII